MSAVDTYIKKINELLQNADLELLDFIFQFLQKNLSPLLQQNINNLLDTCPLFRVKLGNTFY